MPTAILLETDQLADELALRAPCAGLLPLAGWTLVSYAARALRACGDIDRLILSGPEVYRQHQQALRDVDLNLLADEPVWDRLEAALDVAGSEEVLLWPANAPLLRPEMIETFLAHAPREAGLVWAVVRAEKVREAFGEQVAAPVQTFGAEQLAVTGLGLLRPEALAPHRERMRRVFAQRHIQAELLKLLGVGFALKLKNGRCRLDELVRKIEEVFDLPAVVQILPYPELALRVRGRAEYHAARERLERG